MKKFCTALLVALMLGITAMPVDADEAKDHICFRSLDTDKDGLVTFEEFEKHYADEEARFKAADADQDGRLTHDEYHDLLGHGG